MAIEIPHFDLPFRYKGTSPVVAEQDSLADIVNCVEAIILTRVGERVEIPTFGIDEPALEQQPIKLQDMLVQIELNEPRASIVFDQRPDIVDKLIVDVTARISKREA